MAQYLRMIQTTKRHRRPLQSILVRLRAIYGTAPVWEMCGGPINPTPIGGGMGKD